MGADMLLYTVAAAKITAPRKARLLEIADRFTIRELREWLGQEYGTTRKSMMAALRTAIDVLEVAHKLRESCRLDSPGMRYPLLVTGGMSWGDEPTELAGTFELIIRCAPLDRQLIAWAEDDWLRAHSEQKTRAAKIPVAKSGTTYCVDVPIPANLGTDEKLWTNVGRFTSRKAALEFIREQIGSCDDAGRINLISTVEELPVKPARRRRR